MARKAGLITAAVVFAFAAVLPIPEPNPARAQEAAPHAWLFGSWTGGLFPAPSGLTAETCLAQPVAIFTRDVVLRAELTTETYTQRVIRAVQASSQGFELRLEPAGGAAAGAAALLGLPSSASAEGFGCESPDILHVERRGENEIAFPGCSDFPNPLVRCPAR